VGLTALATPVPAPSTRAGGGWWRDPVVWVSALFLATFLLQRIAAPGLPVSITVPLGVGWLALVALLGVVEVNRIRLLIWLSAAGLSGLLVMLQMVALVNPYVSVNSWALWMVTWLPLIVQLKQRDRATYLRFARVTAAMGVGMATLSLAFIGSQVVGIRYYDWLSTVVPHSLLVQDYAISYPIVYGSQLYKSNGWIALEPSFLSFYLGVALICALMARVRVGWAVLIAAGMLSTVAGSGLALVAVFLLVLALQGRLGSLRRYLIPGAAVFAVFSFTVLGDAVLGRLGEAGQQNSSTSLRSIQPYVYLWPRWLSDPIGIFIGYGPGSSVNMLNTLGIEGLLVPSIAKVLFDYGLVAGALLIALMVSTYLRGPSSAFAISLAASMFLIQAPAGPLVMCSVVAISLWAPATGRGDVAPLRSAEERRLRLARRLQGSRPRLGVIRGPAGDSVSYR
jgi:hypothetical protein